MRYRLGTVLLVGAVAAVGSSTSTSAATASAPLCFGQPATIIGTEGEDAPLNGTPGDDVIVGLGHDDQIFGYGGNDRICGGDGWDGINGGDGNDILAGGAKADGLDGGDGDDRLVGNSGRDGFDGGAGADSFDGGRGIDGAVYTEVPNAIDVDLAAGTATGDGTDTLVDMENILGSRFNDELAGNAVRNYIDGYLGDDVIRGREGDDQLDGGGNITESNTIYGGDGVDYCLYGTTYSGCEQTYPPE